MQNRKSINKHFYFAQVIPLILYLVFSLFGYAIYDHGGILMASINVADGLAPYRDFLWVTTPFTLYTQAFFQHLFWFTSPIIISVLWKGITYLILSFTSLVFISKTNLEIGTKEPLPTPLIYLFSLTFFLVGPINEAHVGYTPDAIFFATMGILFMLWPKPGITDFIKNETIHFVGFFLLGLSFCYKQEIGIISIAGGIIFIITRYFVIFKKLETRNFWNLIFIPIFLVLLPTFLLFLYFYSTGQFNDFFHSVFVIPLLVKKAGSGILESLLTFQMGSDLQNLVLSIINGKDPFNIPALFNIKSWILIFINHLPVCVAIFSFIFAWQINSAKSFPATVFKKYLINGRPGKIIFRLLLIIGILLGFSQLIEENSWIGRFFTPLTNSELTRIIKLLTRLLFDFSSLALLWLSLSLFIFSWFKLNLRKKVSIPFLRYFMGVSLLLLVFDGAALAGLEDNRFARIIIPLLLSATMIAMVYSGNFLNFKKIAYLNIYWVLLTIIIFFFCSRFGNSMFSAVMSDPLHRQISYSHRLKCYVDTQVLHSMDNMKRIIDKDKNARVFVYLSESMLYYYFEKRPPTFSIVHYNDFYPHSMDSIEIKKIANVRFVIRQNRFEKVDSILTWKKDPIQQYVENNYRIVYNDNYYTLWESRSIVNLNN